jgi:hypothetical protein
MTLSLQWHNEVLCKVCQFITVCFILHEEWCLVKALFFFTPSQPLTEMSIRSFPGDKVRPLVTRQTRRHLWVDRQENVVSSTFHDLTGLQRMLPCWLCFYLPVFTCIQNWHSTLVKVQNYIALTKHVISNQRVVFLQIITVAAEICNCISS